MVNFRIIRGFLAALTIAAALTTVLPAQFPDSAKLLASQGEALKKLAYMDGVWRGEAWTLLPTGEKHVITQTERIGPFLGGTVKVIEGRGYETDGKVGFNALGIISWDMSRQAFSMRSYAQGLCGDFTLNLNPDGYVWEIPAGPATIRYTAVVKDGRWKEVGDGIASTRPESKSEPRA